MSTDLLTCKQIHQHVSILVREAGGRLIGGSGGVEPPPGQNNGVHLQLQVIISEPILIILAIPENNYLIICLGKVISQLLYKT